MIPLVHFLPYANRLRFSKELESQFRQEYAEETLPSSRVALVLGIFLYAAFGILDTWLVPFTKNFCWFVRFAVVCPRVALVLGLTFVQAFRAWVQVAFAGTVLVAGLGIVAMIAVMRPEEAG